MDIDEAVEYVGAERVNAVLDAGAMPASSAFSGLWREALAKALAWKALATADTGAVRLAATSVEELIAACQEGSETACAELDRRGVEPPLLEIDNADLPIGESEETSCRRSSCNLPVYRDGLCEPCWEIGRDELDAALGEGRR